MTLWCNEWCVGQVSELRGEVSRLEAEKEELERELDTQTNHTHKQVSNTALSVSTAVSAWRVSQWCRVDMMCAELYTLICLCVCFVGINAPVSGPDFRGPPPGFAEIF